jgi:hypothetical protein
MTIKPPRPLGKHGEALWHSIQSEYHVSDSGGVELLAQVCAALDRAEQLAAEIAKDGAVICTAKGETKTHPGVKEELALRAFIGRTITRLGVDVVESKRGPSRPTGPQWIGHDRRRSA